MTAWSASVRSGKRSPYLLRKRWWLAASSGETPITGTPEAWKPARLSLNWQASLVQAKAQLEHYFRLVAPCSALAGDTAWVPSDWRSRPTQSRLACRHLTTEGGLAWIPSWSSSPCLMAAAYWSRSTTKNPASNGPAGWTTSLPSQTLPGRRHGPDSGHGHPHPDDAPGPAPPA